MQKNTNSLKLKIKKGDIVKIISGAHKGLQGSVLRLKPDAISPKILVQGVNLKKHYHKKTEQNPAGGIVEKEGYLAYSNVVLLEKNA